MLLPVIHFLNVLINGLKFLAGHQQNVLLSIQMSIFLPGLVLV